MKNNSTIPFNYAALLYPALASLCLLSGYSAFAADSSATSKKKTERWFEIEVILFKQKNNSENSEQFTPNDLTFKKQRAIDLLAPYLQPEIASLKQRLPSCETQQPEVSYTQVPSLNIPYTSLSQKITIPSYIMWDDNITLDTPINIPDDTSDLSVEEALIDSHNLAVGVREGNSLEAPPQESSISQTISPSAMPVTVIPSKPEALEGANSIASAELEAQTAETDEQYATSYQSTYATIELPIYTQYPIDSQTQLCIIPTDTIKQHLTPEQLANFNIDGFPVEKLSTTIDGLEQWQDDENGEITWASDKPYLISQDSLKLKPIANRIKRSRNYVPLLHLGWRQVGEGSRQAKAFKIYTGENLELDYQEAIAKYITEQQAYEIKNILEQRKSAETIVSSQINNRISDGFSGDNNPIIDTDHVNSSTKAMNNLSTLEQQRLLVKQQKINDIVEQFKLVNAQSTPIESTAGNSPIVYEYKDPAEVKRIVDELSFDISAPELPLHLTSDITPDAALLLPEGLASSITPTAPSQPWSLDGLFKVHLEHYLYINSEFNILSPDDSPKISNTGKIESNKSKQISFKQNRRVITGEIHYFDHPNIGMVVQIRRFDPTKPAAEAVTQSKK